MADFWVKYALRVCHIGSMIALCHKTIGDYQTQQLSIKDSGFYMAMGVMAIVSGTIYR